MGMATNRYVTDGVIGVDLDRVDTTQQHPLGMKVRDNEGGVWRYCKASAAVTLGFCCLLTHAADAWTAAMINLTTSATARGSLVGFPCMTLAINEYGWFQVGGPCDNIRVLASAVARVRLNTTATDGALDDDGTASSEEVVGVTIDTTNGGAAATVAGYLVEDVAVGVTL